MQEICFTLVCSVTFQLMAVTFNGQVQTRPKCFRACNCSWATFDIGGNQRGGGESRQRDMTESARQKAAVSLSQKP